MAKITRSLDDIEKLVKKAHQTPQEQLKEVQEELARQKSVNINGLVTDKEKLLIEAEKILLEQIEEEENKKELDQIKLNERLEKQTKKEIKELLFSSLDYNFQKYPPKYHKKVYEILHTPEAITEEVEKITGVYGLEFSDYVKSIYKKTLDQVFNLYKFNVEQREKEEKEQERQRIEAAKKINRRIKRSIKKDLVIIGLLKLTDRKKRYR